MENEDLSAEVKRLNALTESARLCKMLSDWIARQVLNLDLLPKALCSSKDRSSTAPGKTLGYFLGLLPSLKCPSPRVAEFVHTMDREEIKFVVPLSVYFS